MWIGFRYHLNTCLEPSQLYKLTTKFASCLVKQGGNVLSLHYAGGYFSYATVPTLEYRRDRHGSCLLL